jgi:hypothetical protein
MEPGKEFPADVSTHLYGLPLVDVHVRRSIVIHALILFKKEGFEELHDAWTFVV